MLTDSHINGLHSLREQLSIEDINLVSSSIAQNKRIDHAIQQQLGSLHTKMRVIIQEVAETIEYHKYQTAEEAIQEMRLSKAEREKVSHLVEADKELHASCQSLKVAVELFCNLNKKIVSQLENHHHNMTPNEEQKLVLANALLVYEITDFSIGFIESFELGGIQNIREIHNEMKRTIVLLRNEQKDLRKKAESPNIESFLKQQVIQDIENRESAISVLETEWEGYMGTVEEMGEDIGYVRKKLPSLRLIRDNAKAQINTLAAVAVLQIVQSNIRAIEGAVLQLESLQLASLSADRVKRLLGIVA